MSTSIAERTKMSAEIYASVYASVYRAERAGAEGPSRMTTQEARNAAFTAAKHAVDTFWNLERL